MFSVKWKKDSVKIKLKIQFAGLKHSIRFIILKSIYEMIGPYCTLLVHSDQKYVIFCSCTRFSNHNTAFSGIEILKIFKGTHPKKFPRRRGPKAPCWFSWLLYSICWLRQLLKPLTPFFHQHCQKKNMHINISLN